MATVTSHHTMTNSNEQMRQLSLKILDNIERIFELFGVEYKDSKNKFYGPCPIHGGDKHNAWNLYKDIEFGGLWKCRTHQCEQIFKSSPIGFVRGLLSRHKRGWEDPKDVDKIFSFKETIKFLEGFLGYKVDEACEADETVAEKQRFVKSLSYLTTQAKTKAELLTREKVRQKLIIPAKYYIERNYSADILDRYDVGLCTEQGKQMHNRIVAPIYDDNYGHMIGCTGRTVYPYCDECKCYHPNFGKHPKDPKSPYWAKWRHSFGFRSEDHLYNYWFAKPHILSNGVAILVESPGNVWRLEESGIHNSVAMFGAKLNVGQKTILDRSGAMSLVVLMDNDAAGKIAAEIIYQMCHRTYRLYFPKFSGEDIGEMSKDAVTAEILPIINQLQGYGV